MMAPVPIPIIAVQSGDGGECWTMEKKDVIVHGARTIKELVILLITVG